MEHWYALRVRSNFENVVQTGLRNRDIEEFLPVYEKKSRWSDRVKKIQRPLFPGYVFGRFNAANRLPILMIPGVVHVLGNSAGPIPVDEGELQAIRRTVESGLLVMPWPYLNVGDQVVVEEGALAGLQGILVRVKDRSSSRGVIDFAAALGSGGTGSRKHAALQERILASRLH